MSKRNRPSDQVRRVLEEAGKNVWVDRYSEVHYVSCKFEGDYELIDKVKAKLLERRVSTGINIVWQEIPAPIDTVDANGVRPTIISKRLVFSVPRSWPWDLINADKEHAEAVA